MIVVVINRLILCYSFVWLMGWLWKFFGKKMVGSYLKCDIVLDILYIFFLDLLKRWVVEILIKVVCVFFYENNEWYVFVFGDFYDRVIKFVKVLV